MFQQSEITLLPEDCPGRCDLRISFPYRPVCFKLLIRIWLIITTIEWLLASWSLLRLLGWAYRCHPLQAGKIAALARDCQTSLGRWADVLVGATLMVQEDLS